MTFLHTDPADPDSPLWFFHLPTFTLARLHLNAGPGGTHVLTVDAAGPPPDAAVLDLAAALEAMAPGASGNLTTVTREGIAQDLPEFIHLAPAEPAPSGCFLTLAPRHGYAHLLQGDVRVSQHFQNPRQPVDETLVRAACEFDAAFIRDLQGGTDPDSQAT